MFNKFSSVIKKGSDTWIKYRPLRKLNLGGVFDVLTLTIKSVIKRSESL